MIERILEETGFSFNQLEKLELQESCNKLKTDVPVCYQCYATENIDPSTDNQQGFVLCKQCSSQALDYAQYLCGFPIVKTDDVDDLIETVRDSIVKEGVLSSDESACQKREQWKAKRVEKLEARLKNELNITK